MIEREVRYKINDEIKNKVISSSYAVELPNVCVDLCMGKYGFDSLDKLGYIIRLRNQSGKCVMESKKRLEDNSWQEVTVALNSMKEGYDFLENIGLAPYLYINRTREVRRIEMAKIFIDKVDLLGTFIEFELEDGYQFADLEDYLDQNGIENKPEKLYGDIFKEKCQNEEFRIKLDYELNKFLNAN